MHINNKENTKVLFLHNNSPDYLADSLFHGLRTLLGKNCVDVPRYDSMYSPLSEGIKSKLRGYGFTLYGLLEDFTEMADARFFWRKDLKDYDLVIIGNISSQWELLQELSFMVEPERMVLLDGNDTPAFFPFISLAWRIKNCPWSFLTPIFRFNYFKRELIAEGCSYGLNRFLPRSLRKYIDLPHNAKQISFSIPQEKICKGDIKEKTKSFTTHIVDADIATKIREPFWSDIGSDSYIFSSEKEYYDDLRKSRFGITTKRAGWDCLRHYELAANGCVLCFRDLDLKPKTCAPFGLNESNCIIYHSFDELEQKIVSLTDEDYLHLQERTYQWIISNTTIARAGQFLKNLLLS